MLQPCSVADFLAKSASAPIIDVRSPAEYAHAHIPGAHNVPLFDNAERAKVGTCYKQIGRDAAVLLGLELVGPKLADFVKTTRSIAPSGTALVHCWRGGMRSGSFAWLLQTAGLEAHTLAGGYKAYRNHLLAAFDAPQQVVILGGKTGSGKTNVLRELAQLGEQVIDLEALAHHKGSAYGAIGQATQPSTEQFENELFQHWQLLNPARVVWIEDESRTIGSCSIPQGIWKKMQDAKVAFIDVPSDVRVARLVEEYACFAPELLVQATDRIKTRLGGQHHKAALEALAAGKYAEVAYLTLAYYDKAYLHGLSKRQPQEVHHLDVQDDSPAVIAQKLIAWQQTSQ
jgi:tRNA 2-selenouridine synthase